MPLKLLAFCTAMLLSTSVYAQQEQPVGEAVGNENPQESELLEMAGKLVSYGRDSTMKLVLSGCLSSKYTPIKGYLEEALLLR